MIKRIILTAILVLCLAAPALGCFLPGGLGVYIFTPQGVIAAEVPMDIEVVLIQKQPSTEQLKEFSEMVNQNWSDGVVVLDGANNVLVLVHEGNLVGECETLEE